MYNIISKKNKKMLTTVLYNSDVKGYKIVKDFTNDKGSFYKIDISVYQKEQKPIYLILSISNNKCYIHAKDIKGDIISQELRNYKDLQAIIKGIKKDYIFNALSNL